MAKTEGVTASFVKELLRRAALISAEQTDEDAHQVLVVGDTELQAALDQLLAARNQLTRVLLGASRE